MRRYRAIAYGLVTYPNRLGKRRSVIETTTAPLGAGGGPRYCSGMAWSFLIHTYLGLLCTRCRLARKRRHWPFFCLTHAHHPCRHGFVDGACGRMAVVCAPYGWLPDGYERRTKSLVVMQLQKTCEANKRICQAHGKENRTKVPSPAAGRAGAPLNEIPGMQSKKKKGTTKRGRCAIRPLVVKVPARSLLHLHRQRRPWILSVPAIWRALASPRERSMLACMA